MENFKFFLKVYIKNWLKHKKWKIINQKKLSKIFKPYIKMDKKIINFDNNEI